MGIEYDLLACIKIGMVEAAFEDDGLNGKLNGLKR
jgi:hypothetical protein